MVDGDRPPTGHMRGARVQMTSALQGAFAMGYRLLPCLTLNSWYRTLVRVIHCDKIPHAERALIYANLCVFSDDLNNLCIRDKKKTIQSVRFLKSQFPEVVRSILLELEEQK